MKMKKTLLAISMATILTTGCALSENQRTAVGAGIGAVAGAVIGHQVNGKNGRYVGAVLGALAGGAIGKYMDSQQEKLEKALASSGITVVRVDKKTIKLNIPNSLTFAVNKSSLNSNAHSHLNSIAAVVNKYNKTAIHVLGFADSDGDNASNLSLSKRRAESAGNYLASQGVVSGRIVATGYGEGYPVASNSTKEGKAQNRRVEVYIRAIEKGNEQDAYKAIY